MLKILAVLFAARQRGVEDGAAAPTGNVGFSIDTGRFCIEKEAKGATSEAETGCT